MTILHDCLFHDGHSFALCQEKLTRRSWLARGKDTVCMAEAGKFRQTKPTLGITAGKRHPARIVSFGLSGRNVAPATIFAQEADMMMTGAMPVYSYILTCPIPVTIKAADESGAAGNCILEFVPKGETLEAWSQMLSSSAQGIAPRPAAGR